MNRKFRIILSIGLFVLMQWTVCAASVVGVFDSRTDVNARGVAGMVVLGTPSGATGTSWNSTAYADGWRSVSSEGCSTNLLVLNGCDLRGGRMTANATWDAAKCSRPSELSVAFAKATS